MQRKKARPNKNQNPNKNPNRVIGLTDEQFDKYLELTEHEEVDVPIRQIAIAHAMELKTVTDLSSLLKAAKDIEDYITSGVVK